MSSYQSYTPAMGQRRSEGRWPLPPRVAHCWVQSPEDHQPPDPGLVLEWRRWSGSWWAWTIVLMDREGHSPAVIQRWFHERDVVGAPTQPRSPDPGRWHQGWHGEPAGRRQSPSAAPPDSRSAKAPDGRR